MTELLFDHKHKHPMSVMDKVKLASINSDPIIISEEAFAIIEKAIEENKMCDNTKLQNLLKRQLRCVEDKK